MTNNLNTFEHQVLGGLQVFKISGKLQYGSTQSIKEELFKHVDVKNDHYVFDLTDLTDIDSTGMGVFVTFFKHINNPVNKVALVIEDTFIHELFRIAKLDTIFIITKCSKFTND
ncbi:STAS domain-containing protein [Bacillus pinisoli]|uniref:STAS domain-containing protein n=1 Tax=Bacillus pinisoli TaxID=2901866 RepID=UPI001FF34B3F|nr:STAS domain-containing protein [Bacillus pinisoli]